MIPIFEEYNQSKLYDSIEPLKRKLAAAAQKVYDQWHQDDDGYDEDYGGGGICDDVASAMADVINSQTNYEATTMYDEHATHTSVWVVDKLNKEVVNVDIPPYNYETGYGYTWTKIKGVTMTASMVTITSNVDYEDYLVMQEYD